MKFGLRTWTHLPVGAPAAPGTKNNVARAHAAMCLGIDILLGRIWFLPGLAGILQPFLFMCRLIFQVLEAGRRSRYLYLGAPKKSPVRCLRFA
jgi:hypothetical protein